MPATDAVTLQRFVAWLRDYAEVVRDHAEELTELDSAIGDADHGANMLRGMKAVVDVLDSADLDSPDALFKKVGTTLVSSVGGASGPLYGTFFLRFGAALQGVRETSAGQLGDALKAGVDGIVTRGKAQLEDKTMYDAWAPALDAYTGALSAGGDLAEALDAAAKGAARGRTATGPLVARKGRASYLGERSSGHEDPGAASTTLLLESAAKTLA